MNSEESDKMLCEIHGDVKVILKTQENHGKTLYGDDGTGGIVRAVALQGERQDQCPARKAATIEGKRLNISTILVSVAILTVIINVSLFVIKIIKG